VVTQGQVDFAETTETENRNGNRNAERKNHASYSTVSRTVSYIVHSWLGFYMLSRGEIEFCSCTTHLIV